jgi:hypothetical protein
MCALYGIIISSVRDMSFLTAGLKHYLHDDNIGPFAGISVAIGNHAWDGTPENIDAIRAFQADMDSHNENSPTNTSNKSNARTSVFVSTYDVGPTHKDAIAALRVSEPMYWEAHARRVALAKLRAVYGHDKLAAGFLLILDSDEIVEADKLAVVMRTVWGMSSQVRPAAMKLSNYWYWRYPTLRAKAYTEDSVVLIHGQYIDEEALVFFSDLGRHGMIQHAQSLGGRILRQVTGMDGLPIVHHYSWVRTKEDMLHKVSVWGHRNDRCDWKALVEKEFETSFTGNDFLKGLTYDVVPDIYGIGAPQG